MISESLLGVYSFHLGVFLRERERGEREREIFVSKLNCLDGSIGVLFCSLHSFFNESSLIIGYLSDFIPLTLENQSADFETNDPSVHYPHNLGMCSYN